MKADSCLIIDTKLLECLIQGGFVAYIDVIAVKSRIIVFGLNSDSIFYPLNKFVEGCAREAVVNVGF